MRTLCTALVLIGAFAIAATASARSLTAVPRSTSPSATVRIADIEFHPRTVTIRTGGHVTWLWRDGPYVPHTVTSGGPLTHRFRSIAARQAGARSVTFTRPGTYFYRCLIHSNMHGRVIVRAR